MWLKFDFTLPQTNGTPDLKTNGHKDKTEDKNNCMDEDILVDEFCSDASPYKPKETDSKKKVVTNGTSGKPTQNGAKTTVSNLPPVKTADSNVVTVKTADNDKDGQKSSQPTPAKDDSKKRYTV